MRCTPYLSGRTFEFFELGKDPIPNWFMDEVTNNNVVLLLSEKYGDIKGAVVPYHMKDPLYKWVPVGTIIMWGGFTLYTMDARRFRSEYRPILEEEENYLNKIPIEVVQKL